MFRFLLSATLTAAIAVPAGIWLDEHRQEVKRLERASRVRQIEQALNTQVSLAEIADLSPTVMEVLKHVARQADVPMFYGWGEHPDVEKIESTRVEVPAGAISLKSVLELLSRQASLEYYSDGKRLVITSSAEAYGKLSTRVYLLPPSGSEEASPSSAQEWKHVLSVAVDGNSWKRYGGPGEIVPIPGALVIRQTQPHHERLQLLFAKLVESTSASDAEADYLAAFSPAEQRIHAVLETPCDFQCTQAPFADAMARLAKKHDLPIFLNRTHLDDAHVDPNTPVSLNMRGASLRSILRNLLDQVDLTYIVDNDLLQVTAPERIYPRLVVYDVRDLVAGKGDLQFDSLGYLISSTVEPESWDETSGPGPMRVSPPGWLAICETDEIHEGTVRLLTQLRAELPNHGSGQRVAAEPTPAEKRLTARLKQVIALDYQGLELQEVAADIAERAGVNVRLDEGRLKETGVTLRTPVTCHLTPLPLKRALSEMLALLSVDRIASLGWHSDDECLVVTSQDDANAHHELLVMDVRGLIGPAEDPNTFGKGNLLELVNSITGPKGWNRSANLSTYQSLLVLSAPRDVVEKTRLVLPALQDYRDKSVAAKTEPLLVGDQDGEGESLLLRIYPVEDLLGKEGSAALDDLQELIAALVLDETWVSDGTEGQVTAVPPGGLLVSLAPRRHEHLQNFLRELRENMRPEPTEMAPTGFAIGVRTPLGKRERVLAFFHVHDLLAPQGPYRADELCALLEFRSNEFREHWLPTGRNGPASFRGVVAVRADQEGLAQIRRHLEWLRGERDLPRVDDVYARYDSAESEKLLQRLLSTASCEEQLYLAFVLQNSWPPNHGYEELAMLAESALADGNGFLELRLRDVLNRWLVKLEPAALQSLFAASQSGMLRLGAIQALSTQIGKIGIRTPREGEIDQLIEGRADLPPQERSDLKLALARGAPPPTYFTNLLFSPSPALRNGVSSQALSRPPWQRPVPRQQRP